MTTTKTIILALLCAIATTAQAQRISRSYSDRSMSDVLIDLDRSTTRYRISFIYNQLEDFAVTKSFEDRPVVDAIRDVIGFYPLAMTVGDSLITVECIDKTQRRLSGQLIDQNDHPVVFANVQLLSTADSTFIKGGVSNENGKFVIPCDQQEAIMRVSCIGFKTLEMPVSIGNLGVIRLQDDQYAINGIVIKGHHRVDKVDRSVFTFSDEQKKNSRQTQEILTTLPGLRYDNLSGTLKTMTGKSLKILINGVETTDNDLKTIPVDKIKNVEYYTVPPARYADVGTLINIKTQPLDAGYAAGFDVMQGLWTAFNNTNLYVRYNKGNHQIAFDYYMEYRNNAGCKSEDSYVFTDGTTVSDYLYRGDYHFGYCTPNFNLKYIYNKDEDLTFQAKFSPNIFTQFWRTDNEIEAHNNPLWEDGAGRQERKVRSFGPSVDLYLNKKLKGNQELTIDLLGTYYNNTQSDHNKQWTTDNGELFDDDMSAKNNKYSLIGEIAYTKSWGKTNLSLGYKATLAKSDYKIRNVMSDYNEYGYTSHNDNHYFYGEIGGNIKKLSYRLGVGGTYVNTDNDVTDYSKLYFTPKLILSYPIKNGQIQFEVNSSPVLPSISQLSNSVKIYIPGLLERGNPYLESGNRNNVKLSLNLSHPYFDIYTQALMDYVSNPICSSFQWDEVDGERCIVMSPLNGKYELVYGGMFYGRLKPFKSELFTIGFSVGAWNDTYKSDIVGRQSHFRLPVDWLLGFRKGRFGATWYYNLVTKSINGPFLHKNENNSELAVFYQHKQLKVQLTSIFFLRTPHYESETLPNDIIEFHHWNEIPDQRSAVCLTLSYNIFSGKQKNVEKKINNADWDKGTL
ncbi:MAG: carboxypeptidase-like regulatory domain-containing protein [Prevotella sp.]